MNNMSSPSNNIQPSRATEHRGSDGSVIRMFDHKEAMRVILAWADHDWPMTKQQAFELRDSLGWRLGPEGRGFVSTVQVGSERDGSILFDHRTEYFSSITIPLTTKIPSELEKEFAHKLDDLYSACVKSMQSKFGRGKDDSDDTILHHSWYLPSKAYVSIGRFIDKTVYDNTDIRYTVSVTIESPAMKDITDAEDAYFEYFGPDAP